MKSVEGRRLLIETYEQTGILSKSARVWHACRDLVRRWGRRCQEPGEAGLQDHSRRPHFGAGVNTRPPPAPLNHLGHSGDQTIASLPSILLDQIGTRLIAEWDAEAGNDLLADYELLQPLRAHVRAMRCRARRAGAWASTTRHGARRLP
jgi:hypothetical protein